MNLQQAIKAPGYINNRSGVTLTTVATSTTPPLRALLNTFTVSCSYHYHYSPTHLKEQIAEIWTEPAAFYKPEGLRKGLAQRLDRCRWTRKIPS